VRVGYEIGAGNEQRMRRAAWVATLLGTLVMCGAATIFVLLPEELAWLIAPDEEIVRVAALLLPIAGAFQIVDGLQVVATGALRGAGDFRAAMLLHLLGFWGLGIPVGVLLTFGLDIGPEGLWMGLAAGLFGTGLLLLLRMRLLLARGVGRLDASK
jgi:MATE family multidrug resistance protein